MGSKPHLNQVFFTGEVRVVDLTSIEEILAVVALKEAEDMVGGGAPIFFAQNGEEQERIALLLSRILKAMAHDLENGVFILTRH